MAQKKYKALVLDETEGVLTASVREVSNGFDPGRGDVFIRILYSSVNYKDGLAVTGKGKIVRADYPFVPGIDLVGEVLESHSTKYVPGDLVIGTGWQIGEVHWGGYSQYQTVRAEWLVPLPDGMSAEESMVVGTAGFTAALAIVALEKNDVRPGDGDIVVTGATGGVGSMSVAMLHRLGYRVVASTGKTEDDYLKSIGADEIIHRSVLADGPYRPLDSAKWVGAIDSVGGTTLATLLTQIKLHGAVAACGLAASHRLDTNVYPFILRGVNLLGIDSNYCPYDRRVEAWNRVASLLDSDLLGEMNRMITLHDIPNVAEEITSGKVKGRVVVNIQGS
ncbi:MAG: oxidoreductase [Rhodothermales bacterium]|nr:oxidoreductase [Rhodothermales bacterium]